MKNNLRNIMFEKNIWLIDKCIEKYFKEYKDRDDLFQVGAISLLESIEKFDSNISKNFKGYATRNMIFNMYEYINSETLGTNINHNIINSVCLCLKEGNKNYKTFEEIYEEYNKNYRKIDKYIFKNLYDKYNGIYYEDQSDNCKFEECMIDNITKEELFKIANNIIEKTRMKEKSKMIYIDYLNEATSVENVWGLLSKISNKYGISRERSRQIVKSINTILVNCLRSKDFV